MRKSFRGLLIAGSIIAGLVVVLLVGWLVLSRMSFPKTRGTVRLEGISAPVTIERDNFGVPHIFARTTRDLLFAEGYVHAQDRYWQMEFFKRIGDGRLSELFGKSQLQTDIFLRTLGIARLARAEFDGMDPETKGLLEAYSAGVNAYIMNRSPARLGLEFAVLNLTGVKTRIEKWTPVNTLAWAKMMALDLESSLDGDLLFARLMHTLGTTGLPHLYTPYRPDMPFTVTNEEMGLKTSSIPSPLLLFGTDRSAGSNGWVIAGSRTADGKPILANDMHLDLQMPSLWYEIGLHGVDEKGNVGRTEQCPYDMFGYSLAGIPGIISGHNDKIAWGVMSLDGDTQDVYIERINPANPDQYLVDGQWKDMKIVYEEIPVRKEKEPYRLRVRYTRHGPVISDHGSRNAFEGFIPTVNAGFPDNVGITSISLRWSVLENASTVKASLAVNRARNYQEFRAAMSGWEAPTLNVVYADVDGNIAYQCIGRIPLRERGPGEAPMPGWTSDYEWKGYIPFDDLPHSLNPPKGYIVNANNPPVESGYTRILGARFVHGYRARRIVEMIESAKTPIGVKEVEQMQADTLNFTAIEVCDALKDLDLHPTALEQRIAEEAKKYLSDAKKRDFDKKQAEEVVAMGKARELLLKWDHRMQADSAAAALYGYVWNQIIIETFRDQYPEAEWPMNATDRAENAVHFLLQNPNDILWDDITTPERETRDVILVRSFRRGYQRLAEKWGKNIGKWRWDKVHTITFVNPTLGKSGIGPIEKIFNRGPYPLGSGGTQVNAEAWDKKKPFDTKHISTMRQIVPMGNLEAALTILPTGESGHPGNRHYADMVDKWRKVEYHPMLFTRSEIEKRSEGRLVLTPK